MPDIGRLASLIAEPGPWTFAYVDGPSDQPEPEEPAHQRSIRDRLKELGAPEADVEAAAAAVAERTGFASPSADVRDRAAAGDHRAAAEGRREVVGALQRAQVDTLILDARMADVDGSLDALDAPPWVSFGEDHALSAGVIASVPAADALARAALLSGARVIVEGRDRLSEGAARENEPPAAPFAFLRWSDDFR